MENPRIKIKAQHFARWLHSQVSGEDWERIKARKLNSVRVQEDGIVLELDGEGESFTIEIGEE